MLYATETGKSEQYAKELGVIFGHAFNAQVAIITDLLKQIKLVKITTFFILAVSFFLIKVLS